MIATVLLQKHYKEILKPIIFMSKKISFTKYNYKIYNKKLLVII